MKKKDFMKLKRGDKLRLLEDVYGRYSGYGGLPVHIVRGGTIVVVTSEEPVPSVYQTGVYFINCVVSDWPEGVAVFPDDVEKVR